MSNVQSDVQKQEKVLAVPTAFFNEVIGTPAFGFIHIDPTLYIRKLLDDEKQLHWIDRDKADADEAYKQIIPYAILTTVDPQTAFHHIMQYTRGKKGGEKRLHDLLSIGLGGHITEEDGLDRYDRYGDPQLPYFDSMMRELTEEVGFDTDVSYQDWPVGLIYDQSSAVGRVHLGIAHIFRVQNWEHLNRAASGEILFPQWRQPSEMYPDTDKFEGWSKIVLQSIMAGHITI